VIGGWTWGEQTLRRWVRSFIKVLARSSSVSSVTERSTVKVTGRARPTFGHKWHANVGRMVWRAKKKEWPYTGLGPVEVHLTHLVMIFLPLDAYWKWPNARISQRAACLITAWQWRACVGWLGTGASNLRDDTSGRDLSRDARLTSSWDRADNIKCRGTWRWSDDRTLAWVHPVALTSVFGRCTMGCSVSLTTLFRWSLYKRCLAS
jgi:hypothetical protein